MDGWILLLGGEYAVCNVRKSQDLTYYLYSRYVVIKIPQHFNSCKKGRFLVYIMYRIQSVQHKRFVKSED